MKKLYFLLLLFAGMANAQIVNIPDANFKAALLSANADNHIAGTIMGYGPVDTNGDGEIEVSEAEMIVTLSFSTFPGMGIQDFTGINSFINLEYFGSEFNFASINIDGLIHLHSFNFTNSNSATPSVFNNLPALVDFYYNQTLVTSIIVNGCPNIETIWAHQNTNLTTLTLNPMPALKQLWAWNSHISTIDIPNSPLLDDLELYDNFSINSVTIGNSPLLKKLDLSDNNITDISNFSNNLHNIEILHLSGNVISNLYLPSSMPNLQSITFNGTSNNNLNFSNYPNLTSIVIESGNMIDLDVSGVPLLYQFAVFGNLFTTIDITNNSHIANLHIVSNPNLISFYGKNGHNDGYTSNCFIECPNLQFVCVDSSEIQNVQNILVNNNLPNTVCNSYCSFVPGGNYNTITGSMTFDADNSGCDTSDDIQPNIRVNINDGTTTGASFTSTAGNYTFYTQAGSFDITPDFENPTWFNFSPSTATISFANNNNNTATQNFCITANGSHQDLEMIMAPIIPARPGFDAVYKLVYRNKGNTIMGPATAGIMLSYNIGKLTYVSSSQPVTATGTSSMNFNYPQLLPFASGSIEVTFHVNAPTDMPPVNIGEELQFMTMISPNNLDENVPDNTFNYTQTVVGSFDPNDITCIEGNLVPASEIGEYLHYIINFENTGTADAQNIVVSDIINQEQFDLSSLQVVNSSNPVTAKLTGNIAEFIFQNINLDSGGHGNILIKIKSKDTLVQGDSVAKQADIFFDYNFPITTNEANTVFQSLSNPSFPIDATISLYPNPTQHTVNIKANNTITSVQLFDVQGRLLQTKLDNENNTILDITTQSAGVYFIKITTDKGIKVEKIVKE
jgi:hypothetical protein